MPTNKIIEHAASKVFCQRVAFLALRAAHKAAKETPNDITRMAYSEFVFRGGEKAVLLALHVVAASDAISAALEGGDPDAVQDSDIEAALAEIWAMRSAAFGAADNQVMQMRRMVDETAKHAEGVMNAVAEVRRGRAAAPGT
jgi:hypothetical protein